MIRKISIGLSILILIGIVSGIYVWKQLNKPHRDINSITNPSVVTANMLAKEYSANEKEADAKYLNKAIDVSGTISEVDKNQDGGLMIVLQTDNPAAGVQCTLRDKGANPVKGQNIEIKGFCSGNGITGVSLTDCVIK